MPCEHQRHARRLDVRSTVTTVLNAAPQTVLDTVLANSAVAKKQSAWAHEPVILQSLDNRDSLVAAGAVNGRRNHNKRVVDVNNVRRFSRQELSEFLSRIRGPDNALYQHRALQSRELFHFVIAALVGSHMVARALQIFLFLLENDVFAACLLIRIVNQEDLHRLTSAVSISGMNGIATLQGRRTETHLAFCNFLKPRTKIGGVISFIVLRNVETFLSEL